MYVCVYIFFLLKKKYVYIYIYVCACVCIYIKQLKTPDMFTGIVIHEYMPS